MRKSGESGQTLLFVAITLVALISMAALAIDVTSLYAARGETQRAADAAALAGAKAFVESGTTTAPTDPNLQSLARTIGNAYINAIIQMNKVGGVVPTVTAETFDFSHQGNPQVTVTVERTDMPTFFAHIFGRRAATVSATSTAEAYNSSNPGNAGAGSMSPVSPQAVKPWMVINIDPIHSARFVNPDGTLPNPGAYSYSAPPATQYQCPPPGGSGGIVGECLTLLNRFGDASPLANPGYLPAHVPNSPRGTSCPSICPAIDDFEQSIECFDTANAAQYSCPTTTPIPSVDAGNDNLDTLAGAACLENIPGGAGNAQDTIDFEDFPTAPYEITSSGSSNPGRVNTSGQVITLPIISTMLPGNQASIVGYMQAFLVAANAPGTLTIYVLNVSGCGTNIAPATPAAPAVSGGGVSPVPVRLIHQ